jgi:hypothetical protein
VVATIVEILGKWDALATTVIEEAEIEIIREEMAKRKEEKENRVRSTGKGK